MTVIILKMAVKTISFPDVGKQPLLFQQKPQIRQKYIREQVKILSLKLIC